MNTLLYAGYVLPGVPDALCASGMVDRESLTALLHGWCLADAESTAFDAPAAAADPVLSVAANLVSRGLPTYPSWEIQQAFERLFRRTESQVDAAGRIRSHAAGIDPSQAELMLDALRASAPSPLSKQALGRLSNAIPADALKVLLPALQDVFGSEVAQLLEADEQNHALLLPFPAELRGVRGIRAHAAGDAPAPDAPGADGWYDLPVDPARAASAGKRLARLRAQLPADAVPFAVRPDPLLQQKGAEAAQLILSPLLMARIQRTVIALMHSGALDPAAAQWRITVIERDVPGAAIAVEDLRLLFKALYALEGRGRRFPEVALTVHSTGVFEASPLHGFADARVTTDSAALGTADCCIDASMLLRPGLNAPAVDADAPVRVTLRTARLCDRPRQVQCAEPVTWRPLTAESGGNPVLDAAVHLLRRCFRLDRFRSAQLPLLNLALQRRSLLASQPAGAGKSLVYQFAGLLQPALTLFITPRTPQAMDQCDMLREGGIDSAVCLDGSLHRDACEQRCSAVTAREAQFVMVTADFFRDDRCTHMLEEAQRSGASFAQCTIDEAHTLSEWSHDPQLSMQGVAAAAAASLKAGKKIPVPLQLLTASISRDVIADLRLQCRRAGSGYALTDEQTVVDPSPLGSATEYLVIPAPVEGDSAERHLDGKIAALERLFPLLPARLEELSASLPRARRLEDFRPGAFFGASSGHAGLLYCPGTSGPLGDPQTVAGRLKHSSLRTGTCSCGDEGAMRGGRRELSEAAAEWRRLRQGESNLLVTTGVFGSGLDHPGLRYTVHLVPPVAVAGFLQESGRAGHDGRAALAAVLFSGTNDPDADLRLTRRMFRGALGSAAREKQQLHDLLREITAPEDSNTGRIANLIEDEFGAVVRVSYWQRGLEERMYVQGAGGSFGYVDLVSQEIIPDPAVRDGKHAQRILEFAHRTSLEAAGSGPSLSSWVAATFPSDVDDGIVRQMEDFEAGATFTLRLGFENDREPLLNQIHQVLWREANIQIQRKLFSEVSTESWEDFCSELEQRSRKPGMFDAMDADLRERLLPLFNRIRTRIDTERAIHRLAMLNVVRGFTVNAAARKFSLTVQVQRDEEYREALRAYLSTFLTEAHTERLLDGLASSPGESALERALYFLVDFIYQHPVRRRETDVDAMYEACEIGREKGSAAFRATLERGLTAKYSLADRLPADMASGSSRFHLIEQYMQVVEEDASGSMLENAAHLEASCIAIGRRVQDEPLIDALGAFAALVQCRTKAAFDGLRARLIDALIRCASASGVRADAYLDAITPLLPHFRRFFSQEVTADLRSELEQAAAHIPQQPVRPVSAPDADPQPAVVSPEATRSARKSSPASKSTQSEKPIVPSQTAASPGPAAFSKPTGSSISSAPSGPTVSSKPAGAGVPAESATQLRTQAEDTPRTEKEVSPSARQRSAEDELDALFAELERTLTMDQEGGGSGSGKGAAASASRPPDPPSPDPPSPDSPSPDSRPSASRPPADPAGADPDLTGALTWLQTFNNRFLKDYESRNARIPAGS